MDDGTTVLAGADPGALDDLFEAVKSSGRGRTAYVGDDDDDGARGEALRAWAARFTRPFSGVTLVGGAFVSDTYEPWRHDITAAMAGLHALEVLLERGKVVVMLDELELPTATARLLGHVLAKSRMALAFTHRVIVAAGPPASDSILLDALARVCEERPVVLVLETPPGPASGAWAGIVAQLTEAVGDDLPLLLVLGAAPPAG